MLDPRIQRIDGLTFASAVNKEDKATIRARLLQSAVNEADQRMALQNALVVAKIARFEYPNDWYVPSDQPCDKH